MKEIILVFVSLSTIALYFVITFAAHTYMPRFKGWKYALLLLMTVSWFLVGGLGGFVLAMIQGVMK